MTLDFVKLAPELADAWDDVVRRSDAGWMWSQSFWQSIITSMPEWGFGDRSFAVSDGSRIVAVMPLQVTRDGRLASTAFGSGGPAVIPEIAPAHRDKILRALFGHVRDIAREENVAKIEVTISSLSEASLGNQRGINPLIYHGFTDVSTQDRLVDLGVTDEALWGGLSADARQAVKRAREAGYQARKEDWRQVLDEYYATHVQTYTRTGVTPHPKSYFSAIAVEVAARGHAVLWVVRAPDGQPVAFHNDARYKNTSLYWTGCSVQDHLEAGINYLAFWEAMLGAKRDGCRWYGVGEVFPGEQAGKLKGLTVFKSKFGGALHRSFKGELACPIATVDAVPSLAGVGRHWLWASKMLMKTLVRKAGLRRRHG